MRSTACSFVPWAFPQLPPPLSPLPPTLTGGRRLLQLSRRISWCRRLLTMTTGTRYRTSSSLPRAQACRSARRSPLDDPPFVECSQELLQ